MPPTDERARFGALLRETRRRHHLTQADLGAHLNLSEDAVATWERGRSLPHPDTARRLDRHLLAHGHLYAAYLAAKTGTSPDNPTPTPPGTSPAANLLSHAAKEAAQFGAWAERLDAGDVVTTTLTARARDLAARALTEPPAQLLAPATALNRDLFTLLRAHLSPAQARDLYTVAAAVSALISFLASDLGNLTAAQIHAATATACAQQADDNHVRAWALSAKAKNAFWEHDYTACARHAAAGLALAPGGTTGVMLACQQADAYAKLGNHPAAAAALDRAAREADQDTTPDRFGGVLSCPLPRYGGYVATAHTLAGRHAEAARAADLALEAATAPGQVTAFGSIAQLHVTKAMAMAGRGELDGAAVALQPVLELPPARRLATITGRLRTLHANLGAPATRSSTVAAPLRAQIADYCANAAHPALTDGAGDA